MHVHAHVITPLWTTRNDNRKGGGGTEFESAEPARKYIDTTAVRAYFSLFFRAAYLHTHMIDTIILQHT